MRAADVLAVWFGGAVGTGTRVALTPQHDAAAFPVATFVINVVGAGLLGLLVERLARRRATARRQRLSLLVGTGFLGGFTTYSALAVDSVQLIRAGATSVAIAYGLGTLLVGAAGTWLGIVLGRARRSHP